MNCGIFYVTRGCPKSTLEAPVTLSNKVGSLSDTFLPDSVTGARSLCLVCHLTVDLETNNPAYPTGKLQAQLPRPSHHLLLWTVGRLLCLVCRQFWEVTIFFCHFSQFITGLTDYRVILLPSSPELSILSQRVRKVATSPTVEDSGLVEVLRLQWSGKDSVAHRVTIHKTSSPGMSSKA